jgi:WD40 repeat protein
MESFLGYFGAVLSIISTSLSPHSAVDNATIQSAILSPDQKVFLSNGEGGPGVWDLETGRMRFRLGGIHERWVDAAFSQDGRWLVTSAFHWGAAVWNVQTGKIICKIKTPPEHIKSIGFSPDYRRVVTITEFNVVENWSPMTGRREGRNHRLPGDYATLTFSPDFSCIAGDDSNNPVEIRSAKTGLLIRKLKTSERYQCFMSFSPDGKSVFTTSGEDVSRWEIKTGLLLSKFTRPGCLAQSASLSSDGKRMAVGYTDGKTIMWDTATSKRLFQVGRDSTRVNDVYFVAHGTQILTVTKGAATTLWNAKTGALVRMIPL